MGANQGVRQGLIRLAMLRDGRYAGWIDRNLTALSAITQELTPENRATFDRFVAWRDQGGHLSVPGVQRQSGMGDMLLHISSRLGWL